VINRLQAVKTAAKVQKKIDMRKKNLHISKKSSTFAVIKADKV